MRCVDERAAADVDADMPEAIEDDELAGLELVTRDWAAHAVLRVRAVRKRDADLREHVHHQPRAVEPCRRGATPYVWGAEIVHRDRNDARVRRWGSRANGN